MEHSYLLSRNRDFPQLISEIEKVLPVLDKMGDKHKYKASLFLFLGYGYLLKKDSETAITWLKQSLENMDKLESVNLQYKIFAILSLGFAYLRKDQNQTALEHFNKCLA